MRSLHDPWPLLVLVAKSKTVLSASRKLSEIKQANRLRHQYPEWSRAKTIVKPQSASLQAYFMVECKSNDA